MNGSLVQCLPLLEKKLVTLGTVCAGSLLSEDLNLPYIDELPVSADSNDSEKADMRIVCSCSRTYGFKE
uniref:Uncharacterized protein n=1 Tax=Amphimedon queenslandica TaxID=400682 RepID=A0A1X7U7W9_AMPQE